MEERMWQGRKEITLPLIVRSSCGVAALRPAGWPITCVALLPAYKESDERNVLIN